MHLVKTKRTKESSRSPVWLLGDHNRFYSSQAMCNIVANV